jgi:hypothetical protein
MATNTEKVTLGNLTIKYSPNPENFQPSPEARMKLKCSLDLAQRALKGAIAVLEEITKQRFIGLSTVGELPYKVLRSHFRLPAPPQEGDARQQTWAQWSLDIHRISDNMKQILLGLTSPLTIADAFSSTVAREVQRQLVQFKRDEGDNIVDAILGGRFDQKEKEAKLAGQALAWGRRGVVSPTRATLAELAKKPEEFAKHAANDPSVHLTPEQQGSIKINFPMLLGDKRVTNARVGRVIVHEASHKFCYTRDFAYAGEEGYLQMSKAQGMLNADSYAYAAVSLYKQHLFRSDDEMASPPKGMNMNG